MTPFAIRHVQGRQVLDSRGRPTVEVDVELASGALGRASVPSGASTGRHEAHELRDLDPSRWGGRSVFTAVRNVDETIAPALLGRSCEQQQDIDQLLVELDGTDSLARLGANATLAVSLAVARAAAAAGGVPLWTWLAGDRRPLLPLPMVNLISGGLHASHALDIQDVLVVPVAAADFSEALEIVCAVHAAAGEVLAQRGLTTLRADEGGYGPTLDGNERALQLAVEAIEHAGLQPGGEVALALDIAATHLYDEAADRYVLGREGRTLSAAELIDLVSGWQQRYPIVSIEDLLAEDDWDGWVLANRALGSRVQLVGDDLFTTNVGRLARGIELGAANAVLVKMNQIGTVSETFRVVDAAHRAGMATVVSARSGETEDSSLADIAVASAAGQIKVGSVTGSERLAKYNQLLRIEERLGRDRFAHPFAVARPAS